MTMNSYSSILILFIPVFLGTRSRVRCALGTLLPICMFFGPALAQYFSSSALTNALVHSILGDAHFCSFLVLSSLLHHHIFMFVQVDSRSLRVPNLL